MSDVAVRLGIVLVSGAAISMGGQWSVYGGYHRGGLPRPRTQRRRVDIAEAAQGKRRPCYRCIWPKPLPSAGPGAGTCEEEGVFGPVVGIVGVQMAAEAMKVILGLDGKPYSFQFLKSTI
jgi:adenylyltransferase/sulfurtransferase